jgi:hypothetical protein
MKMNGFHLYKFISVLIVFHYGLLGAQESSSSSLDSSKTTMQASASQVTVKSPKGAMLRSLIVPGWGQLYNGKWFKALVAAGAEIGLVSNAVIQNQYAVRSSTQLEREFYQDNRRLSLWWLGAVLLYSVADAYVDAQLYQFDESPGLSLYQHNESIGLSIRIAL